MWRVLISYILRTMAHGSVKLVIAISGGGVYGYSNLSFETGTKTKIIYLFLFGVYLTLTNKNLLNYNLHDLNVVEAISCFFKS